MTDRDLSLSLAKALLSSHLGESGRPSASAPARPPFTISISRETGALGNSVATEVGRRLGWPAYDRTILEKVAEELRRAPAHLEGVDERPASWVGECLSCFFDKRYVGPDAYRKHLAAVVRALAAAGSCVIVGRGANFILPTETTLRVRLVALPEDRARNVAARLGLTTREAAEWVEKTERERIEFVKAAFKQDPTDSHHYDLVLNTSRLSVAEAADLITDALRRLERRATPAERAGEAARQASPALA